MESWWTLVIILGKLLLLNAKPNCKIYGETGTELICAPKDEDYILVRGLVSDSNKTTKVTLRSCRILDIRLESFKGLKSLKHLDLSQNKIQTLKLGIFDGIKEVTYLNLSYNQLTTLPLGLLDQKPNLEVLDLRENIINVLKLGVFDGTPELKYIDLSGNEISGKDFNAYIFDRSRRVNVVDFSRNDMQGTPDNILHAFTLIEYLYLDSCFLNEIPKFAVRSNLKTMKNLILSRNAIREIKEPTTFVNLEKLEVLDLADNNIENINENVLQPLKKLKMVVLRNNKLKTISKNLFQNVPKLISIDLSHNYLEFVPIVTFKGTSLKNLNLSSNRITYIDANFCIELKNFGVRLTKLYFAQNPWQCACLLEIIDEMKSLAVEYNTSKYNGIDPVCVTLEEFKCKREKASNKLFIEMYSNVIRSK